VQLRLFQNRNMTVAVTAMSLFAIAFFGASLLFPLYFQQVRGEDALGAGVLLAPQGIGAMVTMPIAGVLSDRIGPGKIVISGILGVTAGMAMFTQLTDTTSYTYILGALFVMGLGMGATMMPIMAAALATLTDQNIARGSTLMNIVQQVAASIGTALFSVLLTNSIKGQVSELAGQERAAAAAQLQQLAPKALPELADAYADVFVVATILVALVLVPAFLLPRKKAERPVEPTAMVGH
jgi:MFS family permease